MRSILCTVSATVILVANCAVQAQQPDSDARRAPRNRGAAERTRAIGLDASSPGRLSRLDDFHLAAWVLLENDAQVRISRFADGNAESEQVRRFARRMVDSHRDVIASLRRHVSRGSSNDGFEFGEVLQDVANRLADDERSRRERMERAEEADEAEDVVRADDDFREEAEDDFSEATENRRRSDAQRRAFRGERGEEVVDRDQDDLVEEDVEEDIADEVADVAERVGERADTNRRERVADRGDFDTLRRDILPVLRDNLPEILDALGETIEGSDEGMTGLSFVELKRQVADKFTDSVIEELKRSRDGDFDQAYLGFELAAHLKMIDTMEVARKHASPELSDKLAEDIRILRRHLSQVRDLMREIN